MEDKIISITEKYTNYIDLRYVTENNFVGGGVLIQIY